MKTKDYTIFALVKRMQNGETTKSLEKEMKAYEKIKAKEEGKIYGKCESCSNETVLVEQVMLCGPCCFGEAETCSGNW